MDEALAGIGGLWFLEFIPSIVILALLNGIRYIIWTT